MTMKKKYKLFSILIFLILLLTAGTVLYKYSISPEIQLSVQDDDLLKQKYGIEYNQFINSCSDHFNKTFPSYKKSPYKQDDLKSSINEEYEIRSVELSKTALNNFSIRADIVYDYTKTVYYKNDTITSVKPNMTHIFLYTQKKNGSKQILWKSATLSY
ncbi:hypothetical protein KA977_14730 [Candidatus Dependentiae bacterium]|nr:hypothetical protein [Candidatus Dependentiae bacterium]